jgi:hypothetical protein
MPTHTTSNLGALGSIVVIMMGLAMFSALQSPGRSSTGTGTTPITPINANVEEFKFFVASDPPQHLTQIEWGTLIPGQNVTKDIYITNSEPSKTYHLTITTDRWGPSEAQEYIAFHENGTDKLLTERVDVRFTLEVFPNCTGVTWFSFNINVNFEEV